MANYVSGNRDGSEQFMPLGKWKPDVAVPMNDGIPFLLNAFPRPDGFYGPERDLQPQSSQSTTPFTDSNAIKVHGSLHSIPVPGSNPRYYVGTLATADGDSRIIARDELGAWSDLSKSGGYNSTPSTPWRFANFGNKILAVQLGTTLQISDGGSGLFRDVNARIRGSDVATVRGFAVLIDINDVDFGEGVQPYRVWWSAIGDAENWPDPISDTALNVQSGFRDLFGGGRLRRIIPGIGNADAIVIAERKMWRMRFVGPPATFDFDEIESDQGTSMPGSVAAFNETFFYYGHNGFYWFDGSNSRPIGQGVVDQFFDADSSYSTAFGSQRAVEAAIDSEKKCYTVAYRSVAATTDANDRILRYNWLTDTWSNAAIAADSIGHVDSQGSTTDSPRMVYIGQDFQISRSIGATLETTIETRENVLENATISQIKGVLPLADASDLVAKIKTRDYPYSTTFIETSERGWQSDGWIRFFDETPTGRFYRCRMRIPAGSTWSAIQGIYYQYAEHQRGPRRDT